MAGEFKINKQGIRNITRKIEREFAKNPVRVPLVVDDSDVSLPPTTVNHNYNAPVVTVNGDHAQIAWDNETVTQTQAVSGDIASGYEELAKLLATLLAHVEALGLADTDLVDVRHNAETVLAALREHPGLHGAL